MDTLLQTTPSKQRESTRTHGALDAEIETYMSIVESIGGSIGLDEAYDSHLKDALRMIEAHVCSSQMLSLEALAGSSKALPPLPNESGRTKIAAHFVRPDDAFLNKLISAFQTFFTNNIELNLALTEAFITLIACPHFRLEGWAVIDPSHYKFGELQDNDRSSSEPEAVQRLRKARLRPTWSTVNNPALMSVLQKLQQDLNILRESIKDLDQLITSRKQAFHLHEEITEAMHNVPLQARSSRLSSDSQAPEQKPTILAQRLIDTISGSPSRSQSPRGRPAGPERRQNVTSSPAPLNPLLSQYAPGLSSPPAKSPPRSRTRPTSGEMMRRIPSDASSADQAPGALLSDVIEAANSESLARRITFPLNVEKGVRSGIEETPRDGQDDEDQTEGSQPQKQEPVKEASLSHVLTNVVILQEFVLEMVAVMQVRASMFGEVTFA